MDVSVPAPGASPSAGGLSASKKRLLVAVIVVIAIVAIALYAMRAAPGGSGAPPANPCGSALMPTLAAGAACVPAAGGTFAWLTSSAPASSGIAPPAGMTQLNQYAASVSDCVTESACQGYCLGSGNCSFYTYDSSQQQNIPQCPATGSVCTTYSGSLPAQVGLQTVPYVTGGIPAGVLAPPSKGAFIPRKAYPTDRCGNFGADECPYLRYPEPFIPRAAYPTDRCGNFGADECPYLRYPEPFVPQQAQR